MVPLKLKQRELIFDENHQKYSYKFVELFLANMVTPSIGMIEEIKVSKCCRRISAVYLLLLHLITLIKKKIMLKVFSINRVKLNIILAPISSTTFLLRSVIHSHRLSRWKNNGQLFQWFPICHFLAHFYLNFTRPECRCQLILLLHFEG